MKSIIRNFAFLLPMLLICISCSKKQPYFILEFSGEGEVYNNSKISFDIYQADSVHTVFLLAEPGDMISLGEHSFYFRDTSTTKYSFEEKEDNLYLNGKIYFYDIPEEDSLVGWYDTLISTDISGLELISIPVPLPESYIPFINKLSTLKPNIGIIINNEHDTCCVNEELFKAIENFNPGFLSFGNLAINNLKELSRFKNLEVLELGIFDSTFLDTVPPLPHLKKLKDFSFSIYMFNKDQDSVFIPDEYLMNFFENNTQIERLTIYAEDSIDISFISPLMRLKSLRISDISGDGLLSWTDIPVLGNIKTLREMKHLEFVNINYCSAGMDSIFNGLTNIRWLDLSPDSTQTDLSTIVKFHPDLEVLTINNDTNQNLQPLLGFPDLYGLIITDTLTDRNTLLSMKNLKYLSVPQYLESDSLYYASLQDSLPGCKIAFNQKLGGCLGSGWLFLLIPFILIFLFLGRLKFIGIRKYL
jgi:hypothetical protein